MVVFVLIGVLILEWNFFDVSAQEIKFFSGLSRRSESITTPQDKKIIILVLRVWY